MAKSAIDLYLGAAAPYGPEAGAGRSLRSHVAGSADWSVGIGRMKNRELHRALVLGGSRLMMANNNQPDSRQNR